MKIVFSCDNCGQNIAGVPLVLQEKTFCNSICYSFWTFKRKRGEI